VSVPSTKLGPPTPSPAIECVPPPFGPKEERELHSLAGEGAGGPDTTRQESLAFCILCDSIPAYSDDLVLGHTAVIST
jgi:hypothetical protein